MTHLSEEALVDLVEGGTAGLDHVETCVMCRGRVQTMRQMMGLLQDNRVPEPSPLFWAHLSERISRALAEMSVPTRHWWTVPRWSWSLAAIAAIVIAVLIVGPMRKTPASNTTAHQSVATSSGEVANERRAARGEGAPATPALRGGTGPTIQEQHTSDAANDVSWAVAAADESWQVVEGALDDLDLDAAPDAGIFVRPGSIDRELLMLSDQERSDLARVIQAELNGSGV